jgi:HPt (histidine-containing phosphotransfer) domain-containing protein
MDTVTDRAEGPVQDIDEDRLREMLTLVGPDSERRLLRLLIVDLQNARLRLLRAAEQKDAVLLREQTHVLASLAATFGAEALTRAARQLEARVRAGGTPDVGVVERLTEGLVDLLSARCAGKPP